MTTCWLSPMTTFWLSYNKLLAVTHDHLFAVTHDHLFAVTHDHLLAVTQPNNLHTFHQQVFTHHPLTFTDRLSHNSQQAFIHQTIRFSPNKLPTVAKHPVSFLSTACKLSSRNMYLRFQFHPPPVGYHPSSSPLT